MVRLDACVVDDRRDEMIHKCDNCAYLENALYQALLERDQAREQAATATDLMMKGESLRHREMMGSILGGYSTDEKKASMVYLLKGLKP
jgi:hypothetical protein